MLPQLRRMSSRADVVEGSGDGDVGRDVGDLASLLERDGVGPEMDLLRRVNDHTSVDVEREPLELDMRRGGKNLALLVLTCIYT